VQFVLIADGSFRGEVGAVWGFANAVGAALTGRGKTLFCIRARL
jgi:hypothetical protein